MLHRPPSSLSSFSSFDSFYSEKSYPNNNFPIMAHGPTGCNNDGYIDKSYFYLKHNGGGDAAEKIGTISKAHKKLTMKAQRLSSALGTELSNSCSALYSMFTETAQGSANQVPSINPLLSRGVIFLAI